MTSNQKISKVFIANRGEIASRVERACIAANVKAVVTASDVDITAPYAKAAMEVAHLPGKAAAETYLNIDLIISKAKEHSCDALHPGYGFLSENAEFAERVTAAGLIFIGPTSETIEKMGDKQEAKKIAAEANVPLSPSVSIDENRSDLDQIADTVGFPLLLKASAGGGGRGMRVVRSKKELSGEIDRAQAEAKKFFGDDRVFAERYIEKPRHVEVQVFGDKHGNVIHFGTRDCSAQRRHQKLVEEAPAPDLSETVREALHQHAVALAKATDYVGAGTVEFLVKGDEIFFLEMNTRIQVEHPVTEEAYGVDLVALQLSVAAGEPIPKELHKTTPVCHAIEFRIYAEDPSNQFAPDLGMVTSLTRPDRKEWFREDGSTETNTEISPYYDAMLTKLIVIGTNRDEALMRSRFILREYNIDGLKTTIPFHLWLLYQSPFPETPVDISYVERAFSADSLQGSAADYLLDQDHRSYGADWPAVESVEIHSLKSGKRHTIEVVHRTDGLFLVRHQGKQTAKTSRISSNRNHGIRLVQALI